MMKKFINKHILIFIIFFSILALSGITSLWWLSLLSIIFFIWNFFNEKKYLSVCIIFFLLAVLLNIFNFTVIKPAMERAKEWGDKVQAEWDKTGYDSTWLTNSQESINVIDRAIENYKRKYGVYPNSISDINDIFIDNRDCSYRVKETDGQTNGIPFYYERLDSNTFYLAGVGKDGVIKTDDDLLPQISLTQEKTTGLIKYVIKSFSTKEIDRERRVIEMFKKTKKLEKLFNKDE